MRGSVTRLTARSWRLRWDAGIDPATGRRRQAGRTVRGTKREAEAVLRQILGTDTHTERHTLAELVDAWFQLVEGDLSPKTVEDRRRIWRLHVRPALGSQHIDRIGAAQLDALYASMRRRHYSPATVVKVHAFLRGAFGQAVKWGWLASNPAQRATPPKQPRTKVVVPDVEAIHRVLSLLDAEAPHFGALYRLGALTGMRRGELCALRWSDVDLEAGVLHVRRALVAVSGIKVEKPTKSDRVRRLAIGPEAVAVLRTHRAYVAEKRLSLGLGQDADGFVFPAVLDRDRPIHPSTVTHRWRAWCDRAGVSGLRLHDLRHHSASKLVAAGVDLRTVMERHGWSSLATTQRYVHAVEAKDREAAEVLERVLRG